MTKNRGAEVTDYIIAAVISDRAIIKWWPSISISTSTVLLERTVEILRFYKKG